jgi:putative ABC transport system permease protein
MFAAFLRRLRCLFRRDEFAGELAEEMRLHVELRARKLADRGIPAEEARLAARRGFGNAAILYDRSSAQWGFGWFEGLMQDIRQAARALYASPGFALFAILTLGVGLGVNTAVFSVVDAVMLRGLPYADGGRLMSLWEERVGSGPDELSNSHGHGAEQNANRTSVSVANLMDYRARSRSFEGIAAYQTNSMNLTGIGPPERIPGEFVSANFFSVLKVQPVLGRDFLEGEDRREAPHVVILTHEFWQRRMGADPGVLGRSLWLDGEAWQIVGVLSADFHSPTQIAYRDRTEFFVPAPFPRQQLVAHGEHDVDALARLKPGVSQRAAQSELSGISAQLASEFPATNRKVQARIGLLQDDIARNVHDSLYALLGASALIVLITCLNIANLLLVRAIARRHETSVRFALGAGRFRVIRQFLVESLLLAGAGCVAGVAAGGAIRKLLVALAPRNIPRLDGVATDWRVFAVACLVATLTGAIFGLAPAWQASTAKASEALRTATRSLGGRSQVRWRAVLTCVQVALSMVLLIGAGLLVRSFMTLVHVDLGFQPDRILAMNINLPFAKYNPDRHDSDARLRFFEKLEARVRVLPGVENVAFANRLPMRGGWGGSTFLDGDSRDYDTDKQAVSPGYFGTLGLTLVRGRLFAMADRDGQPGVSIVNQAFARQLLNGADPVGRRWRYGPGSKWMTVVGMVSDLRREGKAGPINPQVYVPAAQFRLYPTQIADFAVRSSGNPLNLAEAIRREVQAIDPDQPVTNVATFEQIVDRSVAERRFQTVLLLIFASLAVVLATIGVFGVLSYSVTQRTRELGIRIALGAGGSEIVGMVLRQAGVMIGVGLAAGLAGAWALTRFVASMLFQVRPHDSITYGIAAVLLAGVSFVAALVPARRGAKVEPMTALRYE